MDTTITYSESDARIDHSYGDPLTRVKGANPYQRYPERSEWEEWEIRETPEGVRYRASRKVFRWAGTFSSTKWKVTTI